MALGDLMANQFLQSSLMVSNHMNHCSSHDEGDLASQKRDSETASSSYGNGNTITSITYLPQTIMLCELRHEAFEAYVPASPAESGLVSKWRLKDRLHDLSASSSSGSLRDCILLAACEAHETLPQSAEFPADVFTSCLTTPIKMALRCSWIQL